MPSERKLANASPTHWIRTLPRQVVALGFVSLLTDVSSEMILPLLPAFVAGALGGGALAIGWIEGVAETISSFLKLVSGRLSDKSGRRRPLVIAGYALSTVARPLVALASAPWHVAFVRSVDRTGKGLRTSPRDALIAEVVPPGKRGAAFGFHRAMDHAGAVLGPLAAILLLEGSGAEIRTVFWAAALPGALAVFVLVAFVREPPSAAPAERAAPRRPSLSSRPDPRLARFLVPLAIFTLGNASDLFLLMKASERSASLAALPALWLGLNAVKSVSSLVFGRIADRVGAVRTIAIGWSVYALVYFGLAFADHTAVIALLIAAYGIYHGLTEGAQRALVAALAPPEHRGAAFGWFHLTVGSLALPASLLFGWVWERNGSASAFLLGACLALAAVAALLVARPSRGGPIEFGELDEISDRTD